MIRACPSARAEQFLGSSSWLIAGTRDLERVLAGALLQGWHRTLSVTITVSG